MNSEVRDVKHPSASTSLTDRRIWQRLSFCVHPDTCGDDRSDARRAEPASSECRTIHSKDRKRLRIVPLRDSVLRRSAPEVTDLLLKTRKANKVLEGRRGCRVTTNPYDGSEPLCQGRNPMGRRRPYERGRNPMGVGILLQDLSKGHCPTRYTPRSYPGARTSCHYDSTTIVPRGLSGSSQETIRIGEPEALEMTLSVPSRQLSHHVALPSVKRMPEIASAIPRSTAGHLSTVRPLPRRRSGSSKHPARPAGTTSPLPRGRRCANSAHTLDKPAPALLRSGSCPPLPHPPLVLGLLPGELRRPHDGRVVHPDAVFLRPPADEDAPLQRVVSLSLRPGAHGDSLPLRDSGNTQKCLRQGEPVNPEVLTQEVQEVGVAAVMPRDAVARGPRYTSVGHRGTSLWSRSRGAPPPPGPLTFSYYTISPVFYLHICDIISTDLHYVAMEVNVARLRELRRQKVLSMRELEEMSGVSYNTIWRLENGKTGAHPRTIRRIAQVLGVDPAELVREGE